MIFEPSVIVLYVDDIETSSHFYQNLLKVRPEEASLKFHSFKLSNGMSLALKAKHTVVPPTDEKNGNGELVFTLKNHNIVDELFVEWQARKINIIFPPTTVPYGYTFVALDPAGNRLRVVSLGKSS